MCRVRCGICTWSPTPVPLLTASHTHTHTWPRLRSRSRPITSAGTDSPRSKVNSGRSALPTSRAVHFYHNVRPFTLERHITTLEKGEPNASATVNVSRDVSAVGLNVDRPPIHGSAHVPFVRHGEGEGPSVGFLALSRYMPSLPILSFIISSISNFKCVGYYN